ncbi:hypothetical protein ACLB2K_030123 [Fragaria x ananassa]
MLHVPDSEFLPEFLSPEILKRKVLPPEYHETHRQKDSGASDKDGEEGDPDEDEENPTLQYKHLIAIDAGNPKGGLDMLHIDPTKVRSLSLSEQELELASKSRATDILRFADKNLLRIYPKGTRLDSSNYDPMLGWMHGAQMVAFNMHVGIAGVPRDTVMEETKAIENEWIRCGMRNSASH